MGLRSREAGGEAEDQGVHAMAVEWRRVLGSLLASCSEAERVVEDDHVAEDAEYCGCVEIGEGAEKLTRQRQEGEAI